VLGKGAGGRRVKASTEEETRSVKDGGVVRAVSVARRPSGGTQNSRAVNGRKTDGKTAAHFLRLAASGGS